MDWQSAPSATIRTRIRANAEDIAAKHRPDPDRVYGILVRTARDFDGQLITDRLDRTLLKYKLHRDDDLFDRAYAYIKEYY
jgi:hypothetical protein